MEQPSRIQFALTPPTQPRQHVVSSLPPREPRENFHKHDTIPGLELNNFTKRMPSEDGTYVLIVTHNERVEKIPQPPTPEEIAERKEREEKLAAEQRASDVFVAKVLAGLGAFIIGGFGLLIWSDQKNVTNVTTEKPEVEASP